MNVGIETRELLTLRSASPVSSHLASRSLHSSVTPVSMKNADSRQSDPSNIAPEYEAAGSKMMTSPCALLSSADVRPAELATSCVAL